MRYLPIGQKAIREVAYKKKRFSCLCDINVQAIELLFHAVKLLLRDRDIPGRIDSWNAMRGMSEISTLYTTRCYVR